MAKILGKDQATYSKERDGFLRDLQHFHETRGTPFRRSPTLGGREIDLYLLYTLVTGQGGWIKVNSKNSWNELLPFLQLPFHCVNGGVALKQIYLRYLDRWEKVHFLGEEADRGSDDDEESRHKRWSARALHSVPYTYNYSQHNIAETNREYNHLSTDLYKSSDYDRLALSLVSPLPNEQDFAINVCTLLSNDGKHTLKVDKHPRIINFLLGHAGVFHHSSLRKLFEHFYNDVRKKPQKYFWHDVLVSKEYLDLTMESKFCPKPEDIVPFANIKDETNTENNNISSSSLVELPMDVDIAPLIEPPAPVEEPVVETCDELNKSDCEIVESIERLKRVPVDPEDQILFCMNRTLGTQDYIGQRVLQIATILRNLSFIDENIPFLVQNTTFMRFILLCASSQWCQLKNLGLDMLGNLAADFVVKDLPTDLLAATLIKIVTRGVESEDRAACISSLEVLNKLSQKEENEDILLRYLEPNLYEKVCSFLTIQDVMLLIYTLECLYSLSSLGERSCNLIVNNHGVVDTLVSLVTVEGKSYGPKACIGMKLVETLPSGVTNAATQQTSSVATTSTTATTVTTSAAATPVVSTTPAAKASLTPSTPARTVQIQPQRLLAITPATLASSSTAASAATTTTSQSLTPQQIIQQQHAHQQTIHENEQFALAWLRATYEPVVNGKTDHQELYKHYIGSCSKIGRRGVISPLHFPRCVRSVFGGTVGPNPMKPTNPNEAQYYEGIKVRAQPLIINIQQQQTISTPTTPVTTTTTTTKGQIRRKTSTTTPHVSPSKSPLLTVVTSAADHLLNHIDNSSSNSSSNALVATVNSSPASPILKAQLSAPPKQRETSVVNVVNQPATVSNKGDIKSQVMAHPHLSQALLGTSSATAAAGPSSKDNLTTIMTTASTGQSSQLIKSLLATKVNDCMTTTVSMRTATDCQNVAQVAARQQRLLAQQTNSTQTPDQKAQTKSETPKLATRVNGARQLLFNDNEIGDPLVSSTTQCTSSSKGKKEPPQPPPPPLAPLSNNVKTKTPRIESEDSDSIGNNSLASSTGLGTVGVGGISSTEDGDNSLTSFEGLLNGIPNIDNPLNEDSNSKEAVKIVSSEISINKPLRLADLLEQKFEKSPPMLNGVLGKEKSAVDLVENHIEKALSRDNDHNEEKANLKRAATDEIVDVSDAKKPLLANVNGSDSPAPDSVSSSNGEEGPATVSTAAAKLFADIAADILEDEDEEQLMQEQPPQVAAPAPPPQQQQILVDGNQQQMLLTTQPRQIIVSQAGTTNQVVTFSTAKNQGGQTVIVQNPNQQRAPVMLQQNAGQFLLSQGLQGQVQLVAGSQPGQYVLQTSGTPGTYMVAQPQTAMVHGQQQTVLVAQTSQQQGTGAKTIIILQQQPANSAATHHQKVVVTPQGQQVVVTQVPRPVIHSSSVSNNVIGNAKVIKAATTNGVAEKKEEVKVVPAKPKIIRDLTTPFVCEWGECNIETKFKSANQVYLHVCDAHCPTGSEEIMCQWDRCDNMKRKRFSLMTHLHDKHCNTESMKQSLVRRKQQAQGGKVEPAAPAPSTPHPGYAPDAALHAIKRHALEFVNPKELQDDNEGPVTKSIRLTASLILRNLVIYSTSCRRYLKHYEPHLANVALSNVESSRTIAQVLYDMNESSTLR